MDFSTLSTLLSTPLIEVVISSMIGRILSTSVRTGTVYMSNAEVIPPALYNVQRILITLIEVGVNVTDCSSAEDKYEVSYVVPFVDSSIINIPEYSVLSPELPSILYAENVIDSGENVSSKVLLITGADDSSEYNVNCPASPVAPSFVFVQVKFFITSLSPIINVITTLPCSTSSPPRLDPLATLRIIKPSVSGVDPVF